jgi:hypothetical protein
MTSRSIAPTTHSSKKETHNSSNIIDSSHKLLVKKKRNNFVGKAKEPEIESEDMEFDTDLDSVFCNVDKPGDVIQHSPPMEIMDDFRG